MSEEAIPPMDETGGEPPLGRLSAVFDDLLGALPRSFGAEDLLLAAVLLVALSGERKDRLGLMAALAYLLLAGGGAPTPDAGST